MKAKDVVKLNQTVAYLCHINHELDAKWIEPNRGSLVDHCGKVYCLQVPSKLFLIRYKGTSHYTGNCSRHGKYSCRKAFKLHFH
jgi:hypothetical protein